MSTLDSNRKRKKYGKELYEGRILTIIDEEHQIFTEEGKPQ